jgi:hypothetical protein
MLATHDAIASRLREVFRFWVVAFDAAPIKESACVVGT